MSKEGVFPRHSIPEQLNCVPGIASSMCRQALQDPEAEGVVAGAQAKASSAEDSGAIPSFPHGIHLSCGSLSR